MVTHMSIVIPLIAADTRLYCLWFRTFLSPLQLHLPINVRSIHVMLAITATTEQNSVTPTPAATRS
jgi:hypothetical protein